MTLVTFDWTHNFWLKFVPGEKIFNIKGIFQFHAVLDLINFSEAFWNFSSFLRENLNGKKTAWNFHLLGNLWDLYQHILYCTNKAINNRFLWGAFSGGLRGWAEVFRSIIKPLIPSLHSEFLRIKIQSTNGAFESSKLSFFLAESISKWGPLWALRK